MQVSPIPSMRAPLGKLSSGEEGNREVQCRLRGFTKRPAPACVCEQRQYRWGARTVSTQGLHQRYGGGWE